MSLLSSPSALLSAVAGSQVGSRTLGLARAMIACAAIAKACLSVPYFLELEAQRLKLPILPLPEILWVLVVLLWVAGGALLLFGAAVPLSAGLVAACSWYTLLLDERTYSNHLLLLALLAMPLAASGGGSLRAGRGERVPGAAAFLLMTQVSTMYAFAGIAKTNPSFFAGDVFVRSVGTDAALISFAPERFPALLLAAGAAGAVCLELFLAAGLWFRATRKWAFIGGALLHTAFLLTMSYPFQLLCFALLSWSVYPLFTTWRPARQGAPAGSAHAPS
ncbi:HTTM domain-containing protein [Nocardiopsis potens]|uniref:HTTM domain-containing protein n=1 Tax=Nocardiopsis potens TaxID=1246458 RepID=UPI00034C1533|nr:HTTM domain-containing protein [Nocardiopsis potens]